MTAASRSSVAAPPAPARRPLITSRQLTNIVSHAYIWICLVVFVLPFLALLSYSITGSSTAAGSTYALKNFQNALGTFSDVADDRNGRPTHLGLQVALGAHVARRRRDQVQQDPRLLPNAK